MKALVSDAADPQRTRSRHSSTPRAFNATGCLRIHQEPAAGAGQKPGAVDAREPVAQGAYGKLAAGTGSRGRGGQ
jgi:hypothetical protein